MHCRDRSLRSPSIQKKGNRKGTSEIQTSFFLNDHSIEVTARGQSREFVVNARGFPGLAWTFMRSVERLLCRRLADSLGHATEVQSLLTLAAALEDEADRRTLSFIPG